MEMRQKYEVEREKEKQQQAQRLLEEVSRQAELQAAMQCKQRDEQKLIIKKHEGESKALEMVVQDQKKLLEGQRLERVELVSRHLKVMQGVEKTFKKDRERIAELEELVSRQLKVMQGVEKTLKKDRERIAVLEEEQESLQEMVDALMLKERTANDFLEEAREVAVQVLDKYGKSDKIDNKLMGTIDERPWRAICEKKFKSHPDGWEMKMSTMISEWEDRMKDQSYHPFKNINLGKDKFQRIIDEDEPHMKKLKQDLGGEVMQTVATAFFEIEEYNASGRYALNVAWNFQKNERVQLKDLLVYLKELLDAAGEQGIAKKKRGRAI